MKIIQISMLTIIFRIYKTSSTRAHRPGSKFRNRRKRSQNKTQFYAQFQNLYKIIHTYHVIHFVLRNLLYGYLRNSFQYQ